ncbi:MAG: methyltransferase domain-containing protein [Firmicutes bacterium]|nr:methyltransferase domain-containing protein [Bacillota bacterium]
MSIDRKELLRVEDYFDKAAYRYDKEHMKNSSCFNEFYKKVTEPIEVTNKAIRILDLGCGTGLELSNIFLKAKNSMVTGIDVSKEMLLKLREKYSDYSNQLKLVNDSYETAIILEKSYNYAISVMSLHHFTYHRKREIYEKILKSLKRNGVFIEGDYTVSTKKEKEGLIKYKDIIKCNNLASEKDYHIDIPFAAKTEKKLMLAAGFSKVKIIFDKGDASVLVAYK